MEKTIFKDAFSGFYYDTKEEAVKSSVSSIAYNLRSALTEPAKDYALNDDSLMSNSKEILNVISDLKKAYAGGFVEEYRKVKAK